MPDGVRAGQVVIQANCLSGADEGAQLLIGAAAVQTQESGSIGGFKFILGDVEGGSLCWVWLLQTQDQWLWEYHVTD